MSGRRMTTVLTLVAIIVVVYLAILGLLWRFQERIVFQPPANPQSADAASSSIAYTSADGVPLVAHVVEAARPDAPIVIAFHGNAVIARWMIPWAREVSRRFQVTVVLPEYRGYDGLTGVPTYAGAAADALAALDAVHARFGTTPGAMTFYGHSLGTAVATELASTSPPAALILESPFTSARDMASRWKVVGLGFVWGSIARVHYDTRSRVAQLDLPVHVAHGERDIVIPVRMGREVHAAAKQAGRLLIVPGAGHNDVPVAGAEEYWRWIGRAIAPGAH